MPTSLPIGLARTWEIARMELDEAQVNLDQARDRELIARQNLINSINGYADRKLSSRENDVLKLLRVQLTNKEIAARMNITVRCVKFHVSNILEKFDVKNRFDLYRKVTYGNVNHEAASRTDSSPIPIRAAS